MTIQELRSTYSKEELGQFPGDNKLRYEMFSPLFNDLYDQKVIYDEKLLVIVKLEDFIITPEKFSATAIPQECIKRGRELDDLFDKLPDWTFGSSWDWMLLGSHNDSISVPYAGWSIWTEPSLVKQVEGLCKKERYDQALELIKY